MMGQRRVLIEDTSIVIPEAALDAAVDAWWEGTSKKAGGPQPGKRSRARIRGVLRAAMPHLIKGVREQAIKDAAEFLRSDRVYYDVAGATQGHALVIRQAADLMEKELTK
jgi:hypothetical protein